jgi:hypothetical protein
MLDDAAYFAQREADERKLAEQCTDERVRSIHLLLAAKYSQLAKQQLAKLSAEEGAGGPSVSSTRTGRTRRSIPRYR